MNPTKWARRFAITGFLLAILSFLFWSLDYKFNFFHLPSAQAPPPGNYTQPASRVFLVKLNYVLCPPLVVMVFGMDLGNAANTVIATVVVAANTALYFIVGLLFGFLWNSLRSFSMGQSRR